MTAHRYLPEETLIKRGIEALMHALGPVETARFLTLPPYRYADTVEWQRHWQETLDPHPVFDQVFWRRVSRSRARRPSPTGELRAMAFRSH
jgi:hypothetical protein